mgnify:CR=1 FL=1
MDKPRKHIRFEPDENTFVLAKGDSGITHSGICVDESQSGCAGVFKKHNDLIPKKMIMVKVGQLDVISAEIRWAKILDEGIVKVGFQYLE